MERNRIRICISSTDVKNVVLENNSYDGGMNLKAEIQNMDASEIKL